MRKRLDEGLWVLLSVGFAAVLALVIAVPATSTTGSRESSRGMTGTGTSADTTATTEFGASIVETLTVGADGLNTYTRSEGCVRLETRGVTEEGCGPLSVDIDLNLDQGSAYGTVPSSVYALTTGQFLGSSQLTISAEGTGDNFRDPCAGAESEGGASVRFGVRRDAVLGWSIYSEFLGSTILVPAHPTGNTGDRHFFIDESGVIRATASPIAPCDDPPIGG